MTRRNLELVEPLRAGVRGATLLETIDAPVTPMGARLLRQWLLSPLSNPPISTIGSMQSRCMVGRPRPSAGYARRWTGCATSSGWRAGRRGAGHSARAGRAARFVSAAAGRRRRSDRAAGIALPDGGAATRWSPRWTSSICWRIWPVDLGAALADRLPATLADGRRDSRRIRFRTR